MSREKTINNMSFADADSKDWYLSIRPVSPKQTLSVKFDDGKSYKYIGKSKVNVGDPVIIDFGGSSSYKMGNVVKTENGITIKRTHALSPLYSFSTDPGKAEIKKNAEGTKKLDNFFEVNDYFGHNDGCDNTDRFRVVDYLVLGVLNAITVVAHPKLSSADNVSKAKAFLTEEKPVPGLVFGREFTDEYYGSWLDNLRYADKAEVILTGHYPGWNEDLLKYNFWTSHEFESLSIETKWNENKTAYYLYFEDGSETLEDYFSDCKEFRDLTSELVMRSALSILIRGGFTNLLKAALSIELPVNNFYQQLIDFADEIGSTECAKLLRGESRIAPEAKREVDPGKNAGNSQVKRQNKPKTAAISVLYKGKEIKVNAVMEENVLKLDGVPISEIKRLKQIQPGKYIIDFSAPAFAKVAGTVYYDYTIEKECAKMATEFERIFAPLFNYCFTPATSELEAWRSTLKEYLEQETEKGNKIYSIKKWPNTIQPYKPKYSKERSLVLAMKLVDRICGFTDEDIRQALNSLKKTKQTGIMISNQNVTLFEENFFVPNDAATDFQAMCYGGYPRFVIRSPRNGAHKDIRFCLY